VAPAAIIEGVQISAKADYAVRALLVLAADPDQEPITGRAIATAQGMPVRFVENTLVELRASGLVRSRRGAGGGFLLGRPADQIAVADVVRAVDGPLAHVRGDRPETLDYPEPAQPLQLVWIAVRATIRDVLERVTLADITKGTIPPHVERLTQDPDAWQPH
jgi:Rrf2 family protein